MATIKRELEVLRECVRKLIGECTRGALRTDLFAALDSLRDDEPEKATTNKHELQTCQCTYPASIGGVLCGVCGWPLRSKPPAPVVRECLTTDVPDPVPPRAKWSSLTMEQKYLATDLYCGELRQQVHALKARQNAKAIEVLCRLREKMVCQLAHPEGGIAASIIDDRLRELEATT